MKHSFLLLTLLSSTAWLQAEPLVVGFERFHQSQPSEEGGRLLFNELGCANCHSAQATQLPARQAPVLAGITQRQHREWLLAFIANPAKTKPGTSMPHLLAADEAEAVLHYLAALPAKATKPKVAKYINAERGSDVFHTSGCVACHQPGNDFQPPAGVPKPAEFTHRSVPLPELKAKYSHSTLTDFLTDPLKLRPDGRMPHIKVDATDATDLAAFLLDVQQSDGSNLPAVKPFKASPELATRGKAIVQAARCAACHELPPEVKPQPVALAKLDAGCLAASPAKGLPKYELSPAQRQSLAAYLAKPSAKLDAKSSAQLTLQALNCTQCHARDGLGGPDAARKAYFTGDHNLGDTGLLPPPLTAAGRKLQPAWLNDVLSGKARVRPYVHTQMPLYGKATGSLAKLLAKADASSSSKPLPTGDAKAGQKLLGTAGGIGCITCHRWAKRPSLGIQALDLSTTGKRLQPEWLRDYLIDPAGYRPGTLMPSFWPAGKAANQTVLGGNTDAQIASILAFAQLGDAEPEGYPATAAGEFELIPKDRPIIQRTFMKNVGAQAILVGFPAGLHLAYDAKTARPALVWKGRFFDAYTTWFSREAPFETPLGNVIGRWPASSDSEPSAAFKGYKLDAAGVPTFLSESNGTSIQDRFEPSKDGTLDRRITWQGSSEPVLTHPADAEVTEQPDSKPGHRHYLYRWP